MKIWPLELGSQKLTEWDFKYSTYVIHAATPKHIKILIMKPQTTDAR